MKGSGSEKSGRQGDYIGSSGQWQEEFLKNNMEMWRRASETHRQSMEACADVAEIMSRHMEEMTRRIKDNGPPESKDPSEFYRMMAQVNSEILKEAMRTPSVLRLFGMNLDAFLDWKMDADEIQDRQKKAMGYVTRRELSQIHKTLYDLRKEVERLSQMSTKAGDVRNAQANQSKRR